MIEWENHDIIIELTPEGRDGASVTPRGVWDENEHYYYLDIVSYNGGSYLAKTDVPAGTLPTDAAYWQVVASNAKWGDITGDISDQTDLAGALAEKADTDAVYTKTETDALLAGKADSDSVYSKTEADALLAEKADANDVYTKTEVDDALYLKADKADTYTKTELDGIFDGIDNALDSKADADSVYSKSQTDSLLSGKANSDDVYTKAETDAMLADKADTEDLGSMASVDDAPSDDKPYARKNGQWAEVTGGGGASWGAITGNLADQTDLANALDNKAPVILNNASGSIASFSDGSPAPVTALSVGIEPVQDLHGYSNPWPAGGGKNLLNQIEQGAFTTQGLNDQTTSSAHNARTRSVDYIPVSEGETLKCLVEATTSGKTPQFSVSFYNTNDYTTPRLSYIDWENSGDTFSVPTGASYVRVTFKYSDGANVTPDSFKNYMITRDLTATYSPYSNVCPISGHTQAVVTRTGKNLWSNDYFATPTYPMTLITDPTDPDYGYYNGYMARWDDNYNFAEGKEGYFGKLNLGVVTTSFTAKIEDSATSETITLRVYYKYSDGTVAYGNNISVSKTPARYYKTSDPTKTCIGVCITSTAGINAANQCIKDVQIELGGTMTDYEEPTRQSVTIDLDGTRYGGTLDVLTGEMTVDRGFVTFDGSEDESWKMTTLQRYYIALSDYTSPAASVLDSILCDKLRTIRKSSQGSNNYVISGGDGNTHNVMIKIYSEIDTVDKCKAWLSLNPIQVVYPLAEPLTIQLTPETLGALLFGENNIWADTGNVTITYKADTKLYIQRLTKPTEDDMIANANIASGKFFMVGNNLYLSTASIASGDAIIPNTNCTPLSLADALNNLNS